MSSIQEYTRDREDSNIGKITIDQDSCIGCGACASVSDSTYELNDDGKSIVTDPNATDDETLIASAESCATQAISLFDEQGNQIFPK